MKTLKNHILLVVLALFTGMGLPVQTLSQIVDPAMNRGAPHVYKYGARTGALGDATVGDRTDLTSMNINPATLSFLESFDKVQVNIFQNWENNLMYENISLPVTRGNQQSLAVQFALHNQGLNSTNLLSNSAVTQPQLSMYQFDLAYAYDFNNGLSVGIFNNVTYAKNNSAHYWTYYPTFGVMYAPTRSISYGAAFRGFGRSVTYNLINTGDDQQVTTLGSQNLNEALEIGATLEFPVDSDKEFLSISLANEKRFDEDGIWYKGGIEFQKPEFLAFRGGLLFQPVLDIYAPRAGIGLITDVVELDYMFSYEQALQERYHQLAITLHL